MSRIFDHGLDSETLGQIDIPAWERPGDWLQLPEVVNTDDKFVGLVAVYKESNFFAHAKTL